MGDKSSSDCKLGCKMNLYKFSKTAAVVISGSFGVAKGFEKWICYYKNKQELNYSERSLRYYKRKTEKVYKKLNC